MRGCFGIGDDRAADQHQVEAARERRGVALEVAEQLRAALVLVDPADVDRERPLDARTCAGTAPARCASGTSEPTPTTTPGHVAVAGRRLDHRALFGRVVHDGRARRGTPGRRSTGRSPDRAPRSARGRPSPAPRRAPMPRVVVAIAEEDDEVERRRPRGSTCSTSAGLAGPSLSSQRELVGDRVRLLEDAGASAARSRCGLRSWRDRETGAR